jgi:hypothetical protein
MKPQQSRHHCPARNTAKPSANQPNGHSPKDFRATCQLNLFFAMQACTCSGCLHVPSVGLLQLLDQCWHIHVAVLTPHHLQQQQQQQRQQSEKATVGAALCMGIWT